jgi:NAD(P)-dependent dehydrogenase (short-subunit alcohol dehydrogenase family)
MTQTTNDSKTSTKTNTIETKWFHDFEKALPSLAGKTIAITGCTSGTGLVAAQTAVKKGAKHVLLLNRASERADAAEAELKELQSSLPAGTNETQIETVVCDLQDFASVREAANHIRSRYEAIDVLCNNAGIMAVDDIATKDGYDVQMQTNHLSHFLLTKELFPLLQRANELRGEARIVNHTSMSRKFPSTPLRARYLEQNGGKLTGFDRTFSSMFMKDSDKWQRYHQTKLANSVFTMALADRLADNGIKAVVAAPGIAATNLQASSTGMGHMMWIMYFAQSAEDGSMPLLAACFHPSTNNGDFWEPAYRSHMIGPPVKVPFDNLSLDPESRKLLWEKSEEACGSFQVM